MELNVDGDRGQESETELSCNDAVMVESRLTHDVEGRCGLEGFCRSSRGPSKFLDTGPTYVRRRGRSGTFGRDGLSSPRGIVGDGAPFSRMRYAGEDGSLSSALGWKGVGSNGPDREGMRAERSTLWDRE